MFQVTRLNGQGIAINCDLVEWIEAMPDTTLRLATGRSIVVREDLSEVLLRIRDWRAAVLRQAGREASLLDRPAILDFGAIGSGDAESMGERLLATQSASEFAA